MAGTVSNDMTLDLSAEARAQFRMAAANSARTGTTDGPALDALRMSGLRAAAAPQCYGGAGGDGAVINRVVAISATTRLITAPSPPAR